MSNPGISPEEIRRRWEAYHQHKDSIRAAAAALKMQRSGDIILYVPGQNVPSKKYFS